jgi:hypothetical protein
MHGAGACKPVQRAGEGLSAPLQLLVRGAAARTLTVDGLRAGDDAAVLVAAVEVKVGVPVGVVWLSYGGRVLAAGRTLASHGLRAGSTVHAAARGRGGGCAASKVAAAGAVAAPAVGSAAAATPAPRALVPAEMLAALTKLDDRLVEALAAEHIKLVRSTWLLAQPAGYRLPRRQVLEALQEKLEAAGEATTPFLRADEAVALVRKGTRAAAVLSHGWLSPGDCDPAGTRVVVVQAALREQATVHIEALFWDQASLPQKPRSAKEDEQFGGALSVMGKHDPLPAPTRVVVRPVP